MLNKALQKLDVRMEKANSLLCVGLDSNIEKLPLEYQKLDQPQFEFNKWIIDQTHKYVCAYKPNLAFYEARGAQGWQELELTMEYLHSEYPDIFTIADAKRADIGSTNLGYVTAIFDSLGFDAVTLHPYLGKEALTPFLERKDKVSIILGKTSNPGGGELQDLVIEKKMGGKKLWQLVSEVVSKDWNENENCMLVVGATYPEEIKLARSIVGEMTLLVPGIGSQGGDLQKTMGCGINRDGKGMVINSSRGIIFSDDPAQAARKLHAEINKYRM